MSTWHWLTDPSHIPIFVANVAFLASIIGGLLTQLLAGFFKTRGDTRQIEAADRVAQAAEKRWQHEQEQLRKQYLLEARRDAYVRLLAATHATSFAAFEKVHLKQDSSFELYQAMKTFNAHVDEASLYNREIGNKARELSRSLPDVRELTDENLDEKMRPWHMKMRELNRAMRRELGLEDPTDSPHTQPQLNEVPVSGETKPIEP